MRRALLTGATGFVGANVARRLLAEGHEVHLLVRPGHASWRIEALANDIRLHIASLSDAEATRRTVRAIKPDWIFHLAAHGAYSSQTDVQEIIGTNLTGTVNLLDAALSVGFDAFIHTGSSSEYGFQSSAPDENRRPDPNSPYAVAKAAATMYCQHISQSRNVHAVTLRLYSVYGAFEEPTRLIPTVIVRGLSGVLPPLVDPDIARDFIYVDDVCDACLAVASRPDLPRGSFFNLGTGVQTTIRDVVDHARAAFGITEEPQWGSMPNRRWDTSVWVSDSRRIQRELNWRPSHSFADGFRKTIDWFRTHPRLRAFYEQTQSQRR
jgi:dolichol-phosphate mannosyltransferase